MNEVIAHSVTKGDQAQSYVDPISVMPFYAAYGSASIYKMLPDLPIYWSRNRDYYLRRTVLHEVHWSNAVGIAITKQAAKQFNLKSSNDLRRRKLRDIFLQANAGKGWVHFLFQSLRDYLTTDNGSFVEIVRASSASGAKILGIVHLDSWRCTRTGDPETPVIYRDREGVLHELKDYQVFDITDMPDPAESFFGVGLCAASRAYNSIRRFAFINQYLLEKVSGMRPQSLHFITGVTERQLQNAMQTTEAEVRGKGAVAYRGAVMIPFIQRDAISHVEIPVASLPDNFNYDDEESAALLAYANAIGMDIQDLKPLTGQALGTGAQSQVLHDKAGGKGLAAWDQDWEHKVNEWICDPDSSFFFMENDYRDEKQKADIASAWSSTAATLVGKDGVILQPAQAQKLLVSKDVLPPDILDPTRPAVSELSDSDNPDLMSFSNPIVNQAAQAATSVVTPLATGQNPALNPAEAKKMFVALVKHQLKESTNGSQKQTRESLAVGS